MTAQNILKRHYEFKIATKIIRLLKQGEKSNYIMAECNCSSSVVSFYRRKLKLAPPSKEHPNKDAIINALNNKIPWTAIQKIFSCSSSTISRYNQQLKKAKLKANNVNTSVARYLLTV